MTAFALTPMGWVRGGRDRAVDDDWGSVRARIELDPAMLDPTATLGLTDFSHIDVIFVFDRVAPDDVCRGARRPRGRDDWPMVGILAQRAKDRPNRLGLTTCQLLDAGPGWIETAGLDAIDGTPVLDIKPSMTGFAPHGVVTEPRWATELMSEYW